MYERKKASKYILYARKSTEGDDRQVTSIEDQLIEMRARAKELGLHIVEEISESGSAYKEGRKGFARMVLMLEKGQVDGIVCWSMSRLSRNIMDAAPMISMLQKGIIKHIRCSSEDWYPETDVTRLYFEFGITNQFSKALAVDTIRGIGRKVERGWFPYASIPLGYLHAPKPRKPEDTEVIIDPERFDKVKHLFDMYTKGGHNLEELYIIARDQLRLTTRKGHPIPRSPFYRIFKNPFYYGKFEFPPGSGVLVQGSHTPMISYAKFQVAQEILLGRRIRSKNASHRHKYNGLLRCSVCGYCITGDPIRQKVLKSGEVHQYEYYHCGAHKPMDACSSTYLESAELERQLSEVFDKVRIPKALLEWGISKLSAEIAALRNIKSSSKESIEQSIREYEIKQGKLLDLLIDKMIGHDKYSEKYAQFEEEKAILNKQLTYYRDPLESIKQLSDTFSEDLKEKFFSGDKNKKREILFALGSNHSIKNKKVQITINPVIEFLASVPADLKEKVTRFEPGKATDVWTRIDSLMMKNLTWGG